MKQCCFWKGLSERELTPLFTWFQYEDRQVIYQCIFLLYSITASNITTFNYNTICTISLHLFSLKCQCLKPNRIFCSFLLAIHIFFPFTFFCFDESFGYVNYQKNREESKLNVYLILYIHRIIGLGLI